jgi:hypothetical protein
LKHPFIHSAIQHFRVAVHATGAEHRIKACGEQGGRENLEQRLSSNHRRGGPCAFCCTAVEENNYWAQEHTSRCSTEYARVEAPGWAHSYSHAQAAPRRCGCRQHGALHYCQPKCAHLASESPTAVAPHPTGAQLRRPAQGRGDVVNGADVWM